MSSLNLLAEASISFEEKNEDKNINTLTGYKNESENKLAETHTELRDGKYDFILVHELKELDKLEETERDEENLRASLKELFELEMRQENLVFDKITIGTQVCTCIRCPFERLCEEAELLKLEMPMKGIVSEVQDEAAFSKKFVNKYLKTDDEVDLVGAPFHMEYMHIYEKNEEPDSFFRQALKAELVNNILVNIDLRHLEETKAFRQSDQRKLGKSFFGCLKEQNHELGEFQKIGLDYMLFEGVYNVKFVPHGKSLYNHEEKRTLESFDLSVLKDDPRLDLQLTWTRFFKFQPLWKIRNYFGEKIGFYFAFVGTLITMLWVPSLFGIGICIYGISNGQTHLSTANNSHSESSAGGDLFKHLNRTLDNDATPVFAMFICIWATAFLEAWKRIQSQLAYQWDVEQCERHEPDRPEFYGTAETKDPVTKEKIWYYPFQRRGLKMIFSAVTLLVMICIVLISVIGVTVYRLIATIRFCPSVPSSVCLLLSTVLSSLLNAISIIILGKLYDILARKLNDWENYRTQIDYDNSLIIKLFAFQFVNSYSSCFYIAFIRGRLEKGGLMYRLLGTEDTCHGSCMSQLSFQVMTLILLKPAPKLWMDTLWPCIKSLLRKKDDLGKSHLENELVKPLVGNFTLSEYNEKIIMYGLMMFFSASFPLAPLVILVFSLIDIRLDAHRLLWIYKRPLAVREENIGTWQVILQLLNYFGVICNAFLVAFTSSWGQKFSMVGKFVIVVCFEHIVIVLKILLNAFIPDKSTSVKLAERKKQFHQDLIFKNAVSLSKSLERRRSSKSGAKGITVLGACHDPMMHPFRM